VIVAPWIPLTSKLFYLIYKLLIDVGHVSNCDTLGQISS
jgi:hypothetical protein